MRSRRKGSGDSVTLRELREEVGDDAARPDLSRISQSANSVEVSTNRIAPIFGKENFNSPKTHSTIADPRHQAANSFGFPNQLNCRGNAQVCRAIKLQCSEKFAELGGSLAIQIRLPIVIVHGAILFSNPICNPLG